MYQSIITLLLSSSLAQAANTADISKIYSQFEAKRNELLNSSDFNKKNGKDKVTATYAALEASLKEVQAIEAKANQDLSAEGNQMAYDLEVLAPIKDLVSSAMSKEDCEKARYEHGLNFPVLEEVDEDSKAVSTMINKICG